MIMKNKNKLHSTSKTSFLFKLICIIFMTIIALTFIYVIVWMVTNSFRTSKSFKEYPLKIFDFSNFTTENYKQVFSYVATSETGRTYNYFKMLANSFVHISIGVIIGLIFEPLIGYVMAKFKFKKLNGLLLILIIISMTIPSIGTVFNTVKFMNVTLNLKNNWLNLIIQLSGGINFSAIIYMNYFKNIPTDYAESAYIDGANEFFTYLKIYFVLASPLLIATTVLRIIGFWNDYYSIFLYMPDRPTIAYGVWLISSDKVFNRQKTPVFAVLTLTSSISFALYAIFSKKIMSSLSVGGVKA